MNAPFAHSRETIVLADLRDPGEVVRIERFVAEHAGTPFHRPAWLHAVEQGTGQRALGLVAELRGEVTGWLPLTEVRSPLFPPALVSSGFGIAGGPLAGAPAVANRLCEAASELAARLACCSVEIRGGALPEGWTLCAGKHANFSAPLAADDEAQLRSISKRQRADVRKGMERPFAIAAGANAADRRAHYACYSASVRNLGTPVFPRALFDAVLDTFGPNADIMTLSLDGAPVTSVLTLYHDGSAMPYWGGGTFAARATKANERLYYELMCHARRRGCHTFDFGRSKVGSGAYAYKKNWGFEPRPLHYATWEADPRSGRNVDPTSDAYAARVALWKRLPLALANRLGPVIARGLG